MDSKISECITRLDDLERVLIDLRRIIQPAQETKDTFSKDNKTDILLAIVSNCHSEMRYRQQAEEKLVALFVGIVSAIAVGLISSWQSVEYGNVYFAIAGFIFTVLGLLLMVVNKRIDTGNVVYKECGQVVVRAWACLDLLKPDSYTEGEAIFSDARAESYGQGRGYEQSKLILTCLFIGILFSASVCGGLKERIRRDQKQESPPHLIPPNVSVGPREAC